MKRTSEFFLAQWIEDKYRKPLIVRGARQVGKSTLVRQFAKANQLSLLELNLEKHLYLDTVFKTLNIKTICRELEGILERKITTKRTLLSTLLKAI